MPRPRQNGRRDGGGGDDGPDRHDEAVTVAEESVTRHRELVVGNYAGEASRLASALNNFCSQWSS